MEKIQYEYKYITFDSGDIAYPETVKALDRYGKHGWQLVSPPERTDSAFRMAAMLMRVKNGE